MNARVRFCRSPPIDPYGLGRQGRGEGAIANRRGARCATARSRPLRFLPRVDKRLVNRRPRVARALRARDSVNDHRGPLASSESSWKGRAGRAGRQQVSLSAADEPGSACSVNVRAGSLPCCRTRKRAALLSGIFQNESGDAHLHTDAPDQSSRARTRCCSPETAQPAHQMTRRGAWREPADDGTAIELTVSTAVRSSTALAEGRPLLIVEGKSIRRISGRCASREKKGELRARKASRAVEDKWKWRVSGAKRATVLAPYRSASSGRSVYSTARVVRDRARRRVARQPPGRAHQLALRMACTRERADTLYSRCALASRRRLTPRW